LTIRNPLDPHEQFIACLLPFSCSAGSCALCPTHNFGISKSGDCIFGLGGNCGSR